MVDKLKIKRFIMYEYFPQELPKCFTTKSLSSKWKIMLGQAKSFNVESSEPLMFSMYKSDKARRMLSIPNPYHYLLLADCIIENQTELKKVFDKSCYSITKPNSVQNEKDNFAYTRVTTDINSTRKINENKFKQHNRCIKLDINSFFNSIYTHTIPWVLHGKEYAKHHKNDSKLLGNQIDKAIRNINRCQTNGILVGNACSRIISEIILCNIDGNIKAHFPYIDICRYVDDYSIYFNSDSNNYTSENEIIEFIRSELLEYNLQINESKTNILMAPFVYGKKEIEDLRCIITDNAYIYLNKLLYIYNECRDISVLKYGLKVVNYKIDTNNKYKECESIIYNIWYNCPSVTEEILDIIFRFESIIKVIKLKTAIIYPLIEESIKLRKDLELVWILYACKQLNIKIKFDLIKKIFESENDLAIIILLDIEKDNNSKNYETEKNKLKQKLLSLQGLFYTSRWLLGYEIIKKGYIDDSDKKLTNLLKDKFYDKLIKEDIDFYDENFVDKHKTKTRYNEFITRKEVYKLINDIINQDNIDKSNTNYKEKLTYINEIVEKSLEMEYV